MGIEISLLCERLSAPGCAAQVRPDQPSVPSPCMSRLVLLHFVLSVEGPLTQTTPDMQKNPRKSRKISTTMTSLELRTLLTLLFFPYICLCSFLLPLSIKHNLSEKSKKRKTRCRIAVSLEILKNTLKEENWYSKCLSYEEPQRQPF